ncbi:MAG: flavodoxin domain-containing protein [Proteobacteria bacterium]|nr:flavodoxin domain-containing protein [Pseudomonadota bacterium]
MRPKEVVKGIYNVGVIDWNIRDFHGYSTEKGTTYNAYLVMDEKIVLIDTVKAPFTKKLLENISKIVDPKQIDFLISNHAEADHSGGLPEVMKEIGIDKPVYCSKLGEKNLRRHFGEGLNYQPVENKSEMTTGKRKLLFLETRMLHWPDSMFTYDVTDKLLFSSDAFGQHYASQEMFDDPADTSLMDHAKKYYANILLLYSDKVRKLIEAVRGMGIPIDTICPDHGVIWKNNPSRIIDAYTTWSERRPLKKAVVIYDTMWNSTVQMADKIVAGIADEGVDVRPLHLRSFHRSDIMTEVMDAKAVVVGSPTLNNTIYPTVADFLTYMKGLRPANKIGTSFGSYGWSGEAVKIINSALEEMGIDLVDPGVKVQYVPDKDNLDECYALGKKIGQAVNASFE